MKRIAFLGFAAGVLVGCSDRAGPAEPPAAMEALSFAHQAEGEGVLTEPAWYEGELVTFLLPAAASRTENVQVVADCFRVGPAVPENVPIGGTVWVLTIPGAWQETTCSTDGSDAGELTHNHVFSVAPGDPGYNAKFTILVVDEGPDFPGASMANKYDSADAVMMGIAEKELTVVGPVARVNWSVQRDR